MESFSDLPERFEDYAKLDGSHFLFPRLPDDSPQMCPYDLADITEYCELEDDSTPENLQFARTADVNGVKIWIWEDSVEGEEEKMFAAVFAPGEKTYLINSWVPIWFAPEMYAAYVYSLAVAWS